MVSQHGRPVGNLPAELTSFVGRHAELADIRQALSRSRLVTLVGAGGVGKTRLALHSASALRREFRDGAWFVDLSTLRDEQLLTATIASALGLHDPSSEWAPDVLSAQLADRRALVVLDNCEHLAGACAVIIDTLLKDCPELSVLATSRQALDIPGEHLVEIRPLAAPGPGVLDAAPERFDQFDAVRLFAERSRAVEPRFQVDGANAEAVATLCRQLDGLPLAIELAAARTRHFSVPQILVRLDDSYNLLRSGSTVAPPRQRSLHTLIAWSHDLCSAREQTLWARLTVFSGSVSVEAAEAVCSDENLPPDAVTSALMGLVDKSILITEPSGTQVRYRMLDTIRAFGLERLAASGEEATFRARHCDHFATIVADDYPRWFTVNQVEVEAWIRTERDNLRAALDYSLTERHHVEVGAFAALALVIATYLAGLISEGRHWLDRALAVLDTPSVPRSALLWISGWCRMHEGDFDGAAPRLESAQKVAEGIGNPHEWAISTAFLGTCRLMQGRSQDALAAFEAVLSRAAGDQMCRAIVIAGQGACLYGLGETGRGVALCREAIAISESIGETWHRTEAIWVLANLYWDQGELDESTMLAREALRNQNEFCNAIGIAECLETLAWNASSRGEHRRAARLFGGADSLWQAMDAKLLPIFTGYRARSVAATRAALGEADYRAAHQAGLRSSMEDNVAFASGAAPASADSAPGDAQLTKRERQIAGLVAKGASNKDIANELVISPRTAEGHVLNILSKLGFTSRVQIAAWVSAHQPAEALR